MDELLSQFLIEGRDLVAEAQEALVALSRDPASLAAIDSLFRATHTLKGSVALFDMAPAERLLHAAEARLADVRKGKVPLDPATRDGLVAIIDQTDRWIDAMETRGAIDSDAEAATHRLVALLDSTVTPKGGITDAGENAEPDWLTTLRGRSDFADVDMASARTAFRYTPDPDCFFRGEDPLAIVSGVPALLALAILPADGAWPALADCEPFRCISILEGVAAADADQVRAAFRLVPDQIRIAALAGEATAVPTDQGIRAEPTTSLRIDAARLDKLADQSGELGVAIRALGPLIEKLRASDPLLAAAFTAVEDEIGRTAGAIQRSIAGVRLVSLEPVLRRLPRLAREAAASIGKTIRFSLDGDTVQVDKQIADQLFEPLLHLVRNAIDHGIEPADVRAAQAKPNEGRIALSVVQDGDSVVLTLTDDGRGIDPHAIRTAAVSKGLIDADRAESLGDADALRLIFLPGFSTVATATNLSGRGVGMDAVRTSVERLAGAVAIDSVVGEGTTITLRLPASAIVTPLLIVEVGDQTMGLRLDHILETTRIEASAIQRIGPGHACVLRDQTVPVLDLAVLLGLGETQDAKARLVITDAGAGRTALRVAGFGERFDAVIREAGGLLNAVPSIAGTTMLADGSVLLVLDLPEILA
ncbi:chemotaxis protein CheA [Sphingomonas montanisoli]|uniref:Chemotaxis protein CheA n=1 Tax=Sphingomonas montanisoli TaxID=2606412 RepID=A0A5D9CAA8_9SPHN|nr:chemotaxis protein CheA [Sphingomonas montanisoli]TZG28714.1 chemotaxis protein CheA [Sphingomonas montanisoli]